MPAPQDPQRPFERDAFFDDPGIVGARWWNRAFDAEMEATRRQALKAMTGTLMAVGAVAALGIGGAAVAIASQPDRKLKKAIDVQREIGWSAGSFDQPLTFASGTHSLDRGALLRLGETLKPRRYAPFWVGTQIEAIAAVPRRPLSGVTVRPLPALMQNVQSETLKADFRSGQTLARLFAGENLGCLVVVDANGPRSVAFAAGASSTFEPVLLLDNWPHPAGIVAAHETLGALTAYERDFAAGAAARTGAPPPLFVLDRGRTAPLKDPELQFDNRYFATLPAAATMKAWGLSRALLVVSDSSAIPEAPDVGAAFAEYRTAGMDVRVIGLDLFTWDGGYPGGAAGFFQHHPWSARPHAPAAGSAVTPKPATYASWVPGRPSPQVSPRAAPTGFGQVPAYVDDGVIVGIIAFGGSRARASGGWGG